MTDDVAHEILLKLAHLEERIESMEKRQKIYNDVNVKEHKELIVKIDKLSGESDNSKTVNGKQNEQIIELTTQLQNYIEMQERIQREREEQQKRERNALTWRITMTMSIIVFLGDLLLRIFGL